MSSFGERLKELLVEKNIDVSKLSSDIGFATYEIYHWWQEKYYPSLANLLILAEYLNVSLDFLLVLDNESHAKTFAKVPPFKDRLAEIIKSKGHNIHKLSKASGVDRNTIYSWIKGNRSPQVEALIKIAKALDCSVDYLIGREN